MKALAFTVGISFALLNSALGSFIGTTNLYSTSFETTNGFSITQPLMGQSGWTGQGSNGNGVTNNYVAGQGQQAYVGRKFLIPQDDVLVWRPINFNPVSTGYPVVKFSVFMSIEDSTNGEFDYFRWSIYNGAGIRLFSLDFDTYDDETYGRRISYLLDGTNTVESTGWQFDTGVDYTLVITMNFVSNRWSATLNNAEIVPSQPITTTGSALTLGDIDAVWLPFDPDAPGNNFMLFDDYRVTAETLPATVRLLSRTGEGWSVLRVQGSEGSRWALDATTNLVNWTALKTNPISGGYYDYLDAAAAGAPRRFYRARFAP
jgi:hypothetical protein